MRVQTHYDETELKRLDASVSESEKKTKNLTLELEDGGEIAALVARLREVEQEEEDLKAKKKELLALIRSRRSYGETRVLRKSIAWREIDHEKRVAECVVRKLPSISPALGECPGR